MIDSTTYICGHKNPDMDSICSAIAYANLKNKIENTKYEAIRCGHLNDATAKFLQEFDIQKPRRMKDAHIHLSDIQTVSDVRFDVSDPIHKVIALFEADTYPYSAIPLFDKDKFVTLLNKEVIGSWFLIRKKESHIPKHKFDINTWQSVIPGRFLKKSKNEELYSSIVVAAMSIESVKRRVDSTKKNNESIILVVGNRDDCIQYAVDKNIDAIIVTGMDENSKLDLNLKDYKGLIYLSYEDTAETTRLIRLTSPIKSFEYHNFNMVSGNELFDNAKKLMMSNGYRCLAVCDENSKYSGFVTRRNFLEKPFHKFILVDHNENEQAISGVEECQIMEIIDHHRIAMEKTKYPIFLYAEPVGSTCTIVYEMYKKNSIIPDLKNAILMQGGIISDTVNLKSPTTTESDRRAIEELEKITGISKDKINDVLTSVAVKFESLKTRESILTDFKKYKEHGIDFAIAQCEVPNLPLNEDNAKFNDFLTELNNIKSEFKLDWVMLMISDGSICSSVLISTGFPNCDKLQYKKIRNNVWECEGVISRKKQLLPEIIKTFED